ncbi:MAG: ABC transporter permease subunit [Eggerthellaceae bacterium]|nr:ABC transporter permease subunit [Eggerthellaceae bacterium]
MRSIARVAVGVAIGLAIWQIMAMIMNANGSALEFPQPVQTFRRLGEYLFCGRSLYGHSIYEHIFASIRRLLIGFGLASLVGITIGSVMGYFGRIYQIGMVPVAVYQMIPGLAWLPVAILLFGLGDKSAIFIIFAVSSMVIIIGVSGAIRMVPPVLVNAAKMSGARGITVFTRVLVPQAAASIVNALRLGMASAWRVLIAAEMVVGTGIGMGCSIQLTRDLLDYLGSFACITVICLFGLLVDRVVLASAERWIRVRLGMEAG